MTLSFLVRGRELVAPAAHDAPAVLGVMGEEEFRLFYERTARPLWAYLSRLTRDRREAEDLLQETYYRFCRAGAAHESEAHRRNSLYRIATNLARDARRQAGRRPQIALDDESEAAVALPTAGDGERQALARTDVGRAMRQLAPAQRELLWLAYAQGESHEHIAAILGLRSSSIRKLLLRARRRLAALLDPAAATPGPRP